jgi:hypothetical protein
MTTIVNKTSKTENKTNTHNMEILVAKGKQYYGKYNNYNST